MKNFILGVGITAIVLIGLLTLLGPRYSQAQTLIKEADVQLTGVSAASYYTAYQKYREAEKSWPLLKFDKSFNQKMKQAENGLQEKAAVIVFFNDASTKNEAEQLATEIKQVKGVASTKYISKEDALKTYQDMNANSPALLELVTADILPTSLEVYFNVYGLEHPEVLDQVIQITKNKPFVEEEVTGLVRY